MGVKARHAVALCAVGALLLSSAPISAARSEAPGSATQSAGPAYMQYGIVGSLIRQDNSQGGGPTPPPETTPAPGATPAPEATPIPNPCNLQWPRHYGAEYTATSSGALHCPAAKTPAYYGWAGIEGTLGLPDGLVTCGGTCSEPQHAAAHVGMVFTANNASLQFGWSQGYIGDGSCTNSIDTTTPELYIEEIYNDSSGNCSPIQYTLHDLGPANSSSYDFTIQYASAGCWSVSVTNVGTYPMCGLTPTGAATAELETVVWPDIWVVPTTIFGGSTSLYLKSYKGWLVWTTYSSGFPWYTTTYDERYNDHPCVRESDYVNYYHFLTYEVVPAGC